MPADASKPADAGANPLAGCNAKNVAWYIADVELPELDPKAHELFVKYSRLPPGAVRAHVLKKVSISRDALCSGD
jgi:hypothetical protein